MPPVPVASDDSHLTSLNESGTLELCKSLADYGEAGGLNRELMLKVGQYATATYPRNLDVLLAAARMYRMGGELDRARATLLGAGELAPDKTRTAALLADELEALGEGPPRRQDGEPRKGKPAAAPQRAQASPRAAPAPKASTVPTVSPNMATQPTMRAVRARERPSVPPPRPEPPSRGPAASRGEVGQPRSERASQANDFPRARANKLRLLALDDPQRLLDPYELIGEIASGGMATVYLGRLAGPSGFQRLVAIKRLHPHLAREEQFVEMFLDEARLAAGIHHPHVVPIFEVGQSDLGYYLVMQFVEGETLSGLTSRANARGVMLPRLVAVRIVLDALLGLHAAHQLKDGEGRLVGLVHRDCTPQNILVGADGSSRITDFGIARAAARLAVTRPLTVKGKVAYLSPEQATAGELTRRSDIFTMGIVLWEALAGRPLFHGDNDGAIVARLLNKPIPSLRNYIKDISPELDEVCGRALQRLPTRRYATAAAMAEALERAALTSLGSVGSHNDVSRCVETLMGAELTDQREAVNAWLTRNEGVPLSRRPGVERSSFLPSPPLVPSFPLAPEAEKPAPEKPARPAEAAPAKSSVESPSMLSLPPLDPSAPSPSTPPPRPTSVRPLPPEAILPALVPQPSWVRRRLVMILLGLSVLFVAGTFPIWFPRANRLRHRLMGHPLPPPAGSARPRPSGAPRPRPRPSASAPAEPPAPPPPANPE